jgi:hypothetical protein
MASANRGGGMTAWLKLRNPRELFFFGLQVSLKKDYERKRFYIIEQKIMRKS